MSNRIQRPALLLAVLLAMALSVDAVAVEVPTLYTAQVPFDREARDGRDTAYRAALLEVLARVSGSEISARAGVVDDVFPDPSLYVTRFRPGENDTLWVSFDGRALETVLRDNGFTVWGGDRPLTLIWLAVDWGNGVREIVAAADPDDTDRARSIDRNQRLRERMLDVAAARGLPVIFPLQDTADLQALSFSDIWGGFDERVLAASERYDVSSILVGRIRAGSAQANRWTYFFGNEPRSFSGTPDVVLARIADQLAAEFSVGGSEPVQRVALRVAGIGDVAAFGDLERMLADVAMIESAQIVEVTGDTIHYEIDVRGGAARLRRALAFNGLTEQEANAAAASSGLDYVYVR